MPLTKCAECGGTVSNRALTCPHCGYSPAARGENCSFCAHFDPVAPIKCHFGGFVYGDDKACPAIEYKPVKPLLPPTPTTTRKKTAK